MADDGTHDSTLGESPEVLASENESLREDAETYQNRIEDLQGQVERLTSELAAEKARQDAYEENQVGDANGKMISYEKAVEELGKRIREKDELIYSLRLNGAGHHFQYGYQKHDGTRYVDHCGICQKDRGHPAHFAQGARYLDSREVEGAAKAAQERLVNVLEDHAVLGSRTALNTAREILRGLPGIEPFQKVLDRPEVREPTPPNRPRVCNICSWPENQHHRETHEFSWGNVPKIR